MTEDERRTVIVALGVVDEFVRGQAETPDREIAADALDAIWARLVDGSKSAALQAEYLGLDVEEMEGLEPSERAERFRQAWLAGTER